jgi:NDP-sugar pyrophosphorylase family protein
MSSDEKHRKALILAGGKGTRLLPYTVVIPKPMLPIGDLPIIEIIARQLKHHGFTDVTVSLGHLSGMIELFLETLPPDENLPSFSFFIEKQPLGTSGPVKAINPKQENFMVINGDILTTLDMDKMFLEHENSGAVMTVATRTTDYTLPLGSLILNSELEVIDFQEKPTYKLFDNIGAYVYSQKVLKYIKEEERIDVNILIHRLIEAGEKVKAFRSDGPYFWIDIGTHADYEKANLQFSDLLQQMPFLLRGFKN